MSSAAGPTTRRASLKLSWVDHSTTRRAGRSVLLHTMARSSRMSPLWTPSGMPGRCLSEVTIAGAEIVAAVDPERRAGPLLVRGQDRGGGDLGERAAPDRRGGDQPGAAAQE